MPLPSSPLHSQLAEAHSLYELGKTEHKSKSYDSAVGKFQEAVQLQEKHLGKYHPDTIKSYWRLGKSLSSLCKDEESLQAFQRAIRMSETSFTTDVTQSLWKDTEACWLLNHDNTDALEKIGQVLAAEKKGDVACKKRRIQTAVEQYAKALEIQDTFCGADSLDGADIRCKLACCLLRVSKLEQAQAILQKAHACFSKRLGQDHPATFGAAASIRSAEKTAGSRNWVAASLSSLASRNSFSSTSV